MDSWKRLISCIRNGFSITQKDFIYFCVSYSLITLVYYGVVNFLQQIIVTKPLFVIPLFALACVFGITILCIQYLFQRSYSKKMNVFAKINNLSSVILKSIQIYVIQFLLFMGFMILFVLITMIPFILIKPQGNITTIIIPIYTFIVIALSILWFYRLLFINNLVMYTRVDTKNKIIIKESIYLAKKNISVIISMLIISIIIMSPQIYNAIKNSNQINTNYISSIFLVLLGIINTYFNIILTVDEIKTHKDKFLIESTIES